MSAGRRGTLALAAAAFVLSAIRFWPVIDDPWDESIEAIIGPVYYGRIESVYQRFGFRQMLGAPYVRRMPIPPELAAPLEGKVNVPYFRHPALTFWLNHLAVETFGWSERSFRVFPILGSSLTAAMLVLMIGGWAGPGWAAAGLLVWLVSPMSWFVGSMTGYEPYTLALMLGAFLLHVRLRKASAAKYAPVWLLVFLGPMADWVALGIVPGIWAFELMTPPDERARRRRAAWLVVPAAASVVASAALIVVWSGGLGAGLDTLVRTAKYATVPIWRPDDWGMGDWFVRQGWLWRTMFTWSAGLLAAATLPALVVRRRTDPLARAALALLVPAVLNVGVFLNHAYIHDYWWYYALPFVVAANAYALRGLARALRAAPRLRLGAVALLLAATAVNGVLDIRTRYVRDKTDVYRDRGLWFDKLAGPDDAIAFVVDFNRSAFYIRAWLLDDLAGAGLGTFQNLKALKGMGFLPFRRIVVVIPDGTTVDEIEKNASKWREVGDLRRLDSNQVAAEVPALAAHCGGGGLSILTIR
jgi:hypothetical protein